MTAHNLIDLLPHAAHAFHQVVLDAVAHMSNVLIKLCAKKALGQATSAIEKLAGALYAFHETIEKLGKQKEGGLTLN